MSPTQSSNPGNFANRPAEEVKNIASKGGHARGTGGSGGSGGGADTTSASVGKENPGSFANRPKEEVQAIGSKGGQDSSGSFEPGSERAKEAGMKGGSAS
jgi:general stress protein YciG